METEQEHQQQQKSDKLTHIHASIDMDSIGARTGYLRVPYSSHESAYGWLPLPIASIRGEREGPTVLLLAGVHGDEYEGQIALGKLIRELTPSRVSGHLIVLPSANLPAVLDGNRLSPVDKGNLNRAFPGERNGTPTQMIAHYIEQVLLPRCEYVIDLHSGGNSLDYIPCVRARISADAAISRKTAALVEAFDAYFGVLMRLSKPEPRTMGGACERHGVVYINPETGGGARVGRDAMSVAVDGVRKSLAHLGVIDQSPLSRVTGRTRLVTLVPGASLVYSDWEGLYEPLVDLGEDVGEGQLVALVHDPRRPWLQPQQVVSPLAGIVLCKRATAWTTLGDCLFEIGVPFERAA